MYCNNDYCMNRILNDVITFLVNATIKLCPLIFEMLQSLLALLSTVLTIKNLTPRQRIHAPATFICLMNYRSLITYLIQNYIQHLVSSFPHIMHIDEWRCIVLQVFVYHTSIWITELDHQWAFKLIFRRKTSVTMNLLPSN